MTALRDRASDPDADEVAAPWDARAIFGARRGLPWWAAVLLAFGLAVVGAVVDIQTQNTLGWVFKIAYFVGSVSAICVVQRRSLFGPMVQPPLILAITVPGVVLLVSGLPSSSDTLSKALAVATPLINGFPTMAITTGCTLAIGIFRLYRQRDPNPPVKTKKSGGPTGPKRPSNQGRLRENGRAGDSQGRGGESPGRSADGQGRAADEARPRQGRPGRETPTRGQRPSEGRGGAQRRSTGESPLPPPARRQPGDEGPRRGEPPARTGKTPPPSGRRPRGAAPDDLDRRRSGGQPGADRQRRVPPRGGDQRGGPPGDPRRGPRQNPPPPRRRPWDDEP
ncbi:MAG TPA: DUF6542 domain-containing protein [Amycolatopsis sp.]|uniref:DUF6542 domain-containing protein n=1 Tax=Amycolatopsis sp. TaxID=37632 RepID=UPI002B4A5109|nr:DUF6542 domain-containing protein [Amycolatopsis sp.]HKS44696.1 DUF6542 domain-containing protein [Amycolatopsis sp.]